MAMVAAGTRTPATKLARVPSATVALGLSGVVAASAPPNAAKGKQFVSYMRKIDTGCGLTHHNCRHEQKFPVVAFP